ncbi:hypothetical protein HY382_00915 [Candidatus Curtissbacteria bacterium]|nr:hypothetical protein [Candidatus Curtissbacteria bacterium]
MPSKRATAKAKANNSLFILALLVILAIILLVVFGPAKIKNLGQLSQRQEKQESEAALPTADPPKMRYLVARPLSLCDSRSRKEFEFNIYPNDLSVGSLIFQYKLSDNPSWIDVSGRVHLIAGNTYDMRARFYNSGWSDSVWFRVACKGVQQGCFFPHGDARPDGTIDSVDALYILKLVSLGEPVGNEQLKIQNDADGDDKVTSKDAQKVLTWVSNGRCY